MKTFTSMSNTTAGRLADFIFDRIVMLPLAATEDSAIPLVRVCGLVAWFFWFFPAMSIFMFPLMVCILGDIFTETWRGTF